jgi:hypothetical protein
LGIVFMKLGFGYIFGSCCLAWRRYRPNVWDQRLGSFGPPGRNWSAKTWLFAQWKASMEWPWGCSDRSMAKKNILGWSTLKHLVVVKDFLGPDVSYTTILVGACKWSGIHRYIQFKDDWSSSRSPDNSSWD